MQQRKIGPFSVNPIGFGAMNISQGYGPCEDEQARALLRALPDMGYNFIDTAALYGPQRHSERMIGEALGGRRQDCVLASKCGMVRDAAGAPLLDGRPASIARQCEQSLRALRTDVIDLYYLHRLDPAVAVEESVGAMGRLVEQGKVRALGLSEISSDTLRRAVAEQPIAAVQNEYSLWSRSPEFGLLEACAELGVALVPYAPLGRGFLADSAHPVSALAADDIRCTNARPRFEEHHFAANSALLPRYREIAEEIGCRPAQAALAWLLHIADQRGERTLVPIPGTRSAAHAEQNLAAAAVSLSAAQCSALDALINESSIRGARYSEAAMAQTDAERDRARAGDR